MKTWWNARPAANKPVVLSSSRWTIQTWRDNVAFSYLAAEWNELHARCATATPFQSHAWLESWWQAYGLPGRLRLILVRKGERLVALAAFMLSYRGPYAVLSPIGQGVSDFADILVDDDCTTEAVHVLRGALIDDPGWHVIDMREVRSTAAAQRLFDNWPGGRWRFADSTCLELTAQPLHLHLANLGSRTANTMRRKLKKIDAQGISVNATPTANVEQAVAHLLRLHELQWQGRDIDVEHLQPRFAKHLARAAHAMIENGHAELIQYRIGQRLLACELIVVGNDFVGDYLRGVDPELRKMIDVTAMLVRHNLDVTQRLDRSTYSMLRGEEPYKMHLRPKPTHNQRLVLSRTHGLVGTSYASLIHSRASAAEIEERLLWWQKIRLRVRRVRAHRVRRARVRHA